jgi:hypothetical protein
VREETIDVQNPPLDDVGHDHIVLDLKEVTLVGQAAVRFLARVEAGGLGS